MPSVLVVDDSAQDRKPLVKLLKTRGYAVLTAVNAYEAMAAAKREDPDLILLDVMIPPMDGLTFLMLLRQEGMQTPVIVLTGLSDENTVSRAQSLNVKEMLIKSEFDPGRLLDLVEQHVRRRPPPDAPSTSATGPAA